MHDPVPRERHLNQAFDIFAAPIINQPADVFIIAYYTEFFKRCPFIIGEFPFDILIRQVSKNLIRSAVHRLQVGIEFINTEFLRKADNFIAGQFIARCNDW